jgi:hypothetical protein
MREKELLKFLFNILDNFLIGCDSPRVIHFWFCVSSSNTLRYIITSCLIIYKLIKCFIDINKYKQ